MTIEQSIPSPHGITTLGTCVVYLDPDYATFDFGVSKSHVKAAAAIADVTQRRQRVIAFLGSAGISSRAVRYSNVTLEQTYGADAMPDGFEARVNFNVTIDDLAAVDVVLAGVFDSGANEVHGVHYRSKGLRDARTEARQSAIFAALKKAEVFCEAANVELGKVIHVEDVSAYDEMDLDVDFVEFDEFQTSGAYNPGAVIVTAATQVSFSFKGKGGASATGQFSIRK